jgi:hypothetical protein
MWRMATRLNNAALKDPNLKRHTFIIFRENVVQLSRRISQLNRDEVLENLHPEQELRPRRTIQTLQEHGSEGNSSD